MPNAVFQQFDSPLQGAELCNTHDRDGHVQVKRWGAQHFTVTSYSNGKPAVQLITVRDTQGHVDTKTIMGGKLLP